MADRLAGCDDRRIRRWSGVSRPARFLAGGAPVRPDGRCGCGVCGGARSDWFWLPAGQRPARGVAGRGGGNGIRVSGGRRSESGHWQGDGVTGGSVVRDSPGRGVPGRVRVDGRGGRLGPPGCDGQRDDLQDGAMRPSGSTDQGCVLEGRALYHIYRDAELETIALRGADIELKAGVWVSVMGPSGSGKSTLLHVLGGLMTPSAGQVLMDGGDVGRMDEAGRAELRRTKLGVMLQRDNLHPLLSVTENVSLPLELAGRADRRRVAELMGRVGLADRAKSRPHQLSGGEGQG